MQYYCYCYYGCLLEFIIRAVDPRRSFSHSRRTFADVHAYVIAIFNILHHSIEQAFQVLSEYLQVLDSFSELSAIQEMSRGVEVPFSLLITQFS